MIIRLMTLLAALSLLAACETASRVGGEADSSGASASSDGTASSAGTTSDAAETGQSAEVTELLQIGDRVFFEFDSYVLSPDARSRLDGQAAFLAANPSIRITIEGHCDERGTREYNLALGESRAAATRDYLVAQGVNPARIKIISYGKERPAVIGSNEEAWRFNRRAVSVIN